MLRRLLFGPSYPLPILGSQAAALTSAAPAGSSRRRRADQARVQEQQQRASLDSIGSGNLEVPGHLAATRLLSGLHCAHLAAAKRGVGPGDHAIHQLPYNTLRLADETLFLFFVIILITRYSLDCTSVLGQPPRIRLGTLSLSTQPTFVVHSLLTSSLLCLSPTTLILCLWISTAPGS